MKVTLEIKDSRVPFFLELIKNFDFVTVDEDAGDSREAVLNNIKQGLHDAAQIQKSKLKTRPAQQLLDEL